MAILALKEGVDVIGIQPVTVLGIFLAKQAYESIGFDFVITSVKDGKHKDDSLHYQGLAFDGRIRHIQDPATITKLVAKCKQTLGKQWDVILEEDHIHFEFDPKV